MSTTDSETHAGRAARRQDRRDVAAPRLSYEALVEIGAEQAGGFEAESVDVSLDGMRMRTAYLPDVGDTLMCRFDGFGGEIVAEAEVVWCRAEARGGEFGIRFVGLDAHALTLLNDLCTTDEGDEPAEPSEPSAALVGTRVRLHIEGLGSPMRARVRDAARGEVLIGSNLEFLKVGRGVELEDVEHGKRRIAHIEHVGVDIDAESNVPQLVVALSYEMREADAEEIDKGELTTAPYRTKVVRAEAVETESTPEPTVIDSSGRPSPVEPIEGEALPAARGRRPVARARVAQAPPESVHASDAEPPPTRHAADDDEDDDEAPEAGHRVAARRATEKVGAFAKKLAPKLVSAGSSARGALGSILSTVKQRHAARQEVKAKERAPKRTTAPPPSSALRGGGRRVLRGQQKRPVEQAPAAEVETTEEAQPETSGRRRTAVTAVLAASAVVAIYFGATELRGMVSASPDDAVVAPEPAAAATALPEMPAFPGQPHGAATANVPLFGATPLSTTEAVPAPPAPGEAADDAAAGVDGEAPGAAPAAPAQNLDMEWGVGEVEEPTVLRLKMDGTIAGITGNETATGFTIVVPNRKSVSSAAGLARKDKRLETVNVVNYPDRAEITLHFKKEVPAFMVRAKGKRLDIEIATAKKKKAPAKKKKK